MRPGLFFHSFVFLKLLCLMASRVPVIGSGYVMVDSCVLTIIAAESLIFKILLFQNQKLVQKLEAQKFECVALENKFSQLREKQQQYDNTFAVVNKSWEELVDDLVSCSIRTKDSSCLGKDVGHRLITEDGSSSLQEDAFLSRLLETGATESTCTSNSLNQIEEERQEAGEKTKNLLHNIVAAIDDLWCLKDGLYTAVLKARPEDCKTTGIGDFV
ncbi:unnamed protein product [Ilex paraguariensis]|uniref:E3 ubiquitin protein ligase n=1 Tax=Ilex paraguariensis TaxID=185542 RepID=A0ABC8S805_9AQUA